MYKEYQVKSTQDRENIQSILRQLIKTCYDSGLLPTQQKQNTCM